MNEAYCRRLAAAGARRPFALPNARPQYAPDRPARIDHIKLDVRFDFKRKILYGRCTTTLQAVQTPLPALELDAAQLDVKRVGLASGGALPFEVTGDRLRIAFPTPLRVGKPANVVIDYEVHQPRQGMYFVGPDKGYPDKPYQVWTQSQDQDAHYWFPCVDYPNAKATTELRATVPDDFFVLGNGVLVGTTVDKRARTKTYHWKMDVPHVTYLVTCVAGRFVGETDHAGSLPVSWYVEPGREADGRRSFGKTPKMVKRFGELLDHPYPYAQYSQIAVRDFIFGGMENTTATTQTDSTLHDRRAHLDFTSDDLVAHELAHQWFGDLLTCKDWSHAWLNEAFATYFDALFAEHDLGVDEFAQRRIENLDNYLIEDTERYRRAIVTNVFGEPIELFDRHLYEKGSLVLHMLRAQLGDKAFFGALRRYVRDNAQGSVETIDLIRAFERETGKNLQQFFDQWVFKAGHPEFEVALQWDAASKNVVLDVSQRQLVDAATPLFVVPVTVEFGFARGKTVRHTIACDGATQRFDFALSAKPRWAAFDPDGDVVKTVRYRMPREMLVAQMLEHPKAFARIDAARALSADASPATVDALAQALRRDAFWGVQAAAAAALGRIRGDGALAHLRRATNVRHPKARRAVADALGEFRTEEAFAALRPLAREDASYFVESAALYAIGKTHAAKAFAALEAGLAKDSWNDTVRVAALRGLAELGDERAIPLALTWSEYGKSRHARVAAVETLGKLGSGKRAVLRTVIGLLDDPSLFVRLAAVAALSELGDVGALPALDRIAAGDYDGRLKGRALEAAQSMRGKQDDASKVRRLESEVADIREVNRRLADRLRALEKK